MPRFTANPSMMFNTAFSDAAAGERGAAKLKLRLDLDHCQIMEGDLIRRIEALAPRIGHVRTAGPPDRERSTSPMSCSPMSWPRSTASAILPGSGVSRPAERAEDGLGWFAPYRNSQA